MLQTRVFQPRLRDFHAVNGYLPPRGALRALELGWQRLVPCVSNLRRSAVCAIGGDAISSSAPRPSGTGGLQTLCWREQDSNSLGGCGEPAKLRFFFTRSKGDGITPERRVVSQFSGFRRLCGDLPSVLPPAQLF